MRSYIVDVFAETALAGNQLAVVLDAADLSTATMQAIARETNFSETTFVTEHSHGRATVRIFTPTSELSFAGHPALGTAWVLLQQEEESKQASSISLQLGVGDVNVERDTANGVLWLDSPPAEFSVGIEAEHAASLLSIAPESLVPEYPIQRAALGPGFQIIAVKDLDVLASCTIEPDGFAEYNAGKETVEGLFVFTSQGHTDDADYAARMFFDADGPREDPATGSANACFAAYLHKLFGGSFSAIVDQGVEMGRASKIYLEVSDTIRVGGKVQQVFKGELTLP